MFWMQNAQNVMFASSIKRCSSLHPGASLSWFARNTDLSGNLTDGLSVYRVYLLLKQNWTFRVRFSIISSRTAIEIPTFISFLSICQQKYMITFSSLSIEVVLYHRRPVIGLIMQYEKSPSKCYVSSINTPVSRLMNTLSLLTKMGMV